MRRALEAASHQTTALKAMQSDILLREHSKLAEERRRLDERVASAEATLQADRAALEAERNRLLAQKIIADDVHTTTFAKDLQRLVAEAGARRGPVVRLTTDHHEEPINVSGRVDMNTREAPASPMTGDSLATGTTASHGLSPEKVAEKAALFFAQQLLQPMMNQPLSLVSLQQGQHIQRASSIHDTNPRQLSTPSKPSEILPPRDLSTHNTLSTKHDSHQVQANVLTPPHRKAPSLPSMDTASRVSPVSQRSDHSPAASVDVRKKWESEVLNSDDDQSAMDAATPLAVHASVHSRQAQERDTKNGETSVKKQSSHSNNTSPPEKLPRPLSPPIISNVSKAQQQRQRSAATFESVDSLAEGVPAGVELASIDEQHTSTRLETIISPTGRVVSNVEARHQNMHEEHDVQKQELASQSQTWVSSALSAFSSTLTSKDKKEDTRSRMKAYDDRLRSALLGKRVGVALEVDLVEESKENNTIKKNDADRTGTGNIASITSVAPQTERTFSQPKPKYTFLRKRPQKPIGQTGNVRKIKGAANQSESVARLYGQHFVTRTKLEEARLKYVQNILVLL